MALEHCLTALSRAQAHIEKYPSQADDAGTAKRTAQHLFTRVLNTMYCHREISDTQVALALLNRLGTEATSEFFGYYGAGYMRNFIDKELQMNAELAKTSQSETNTDPDLETLDSTSDADDTESMSDDGSCSQRSALLDPMDAEDHIPSPDRTELGPAPFYKTCNKDGGDVRSVPVPYQYHWRMRGAGLAMLTPAEYSSLVEIDRLTKRSGIDDDAEYDSEEEKQDVLEENSEDLQKHHGGRKASHTFRFDEHHPLYHSHGQYLKFKQPTLIYNGYPPSFPGPPPKQPETNQKDYRRHYKSWKSKADNFAKYYLCSFRPMPHVYSKPHKIGNEKDFTWEALSCWVEEMEASPRLIDRLRLDAMFNNMAGFRSKSKHQSIVSAYRTRNRTIWTEAQRAEDKELFSGFKTCRQALMEEDEEDNGANHHVFRQNDISQLYQELKYCREQSTALDSVYGCFQPEVNCTHPGGLDSTAWKQVCHEVIQDKTLTEIREASGRIRNGRPQQSNHHSNTDSNSDDINDDDASDSSDSGNNSGWYVETHSGGHEGTSPKSDNDVASTETISDYLDGRKLSANQRIVMNRIRMYFDQLGSVCQRNSPKPAAPKLLITGDPGAGKSYIIETVVELAERMRVGHVQTTSFNGIAAVNIDGATLLSLLGIDQCMKSETNFAEAKANISEDQLRSIGNNVNSDTLALFVVDEISTIDAPIIAMIDARLQRIMGVAEPFGGLAMLFVGDFNQLGAVKKTFLLDDMMAWAEYQKNLQKTIAPPNQPKATTNKRKKAQLEKSGVPLQVSAEKMLRGAKQRQARNKQAKRSQKVNTSIYSRYSVRGLVHHGCRAFSKFERYHNTEQHRSDDPVHMRFVKKLAKGDAITLKDLTRYKAFTKKEANDSEWKFAPILVTTNRERMAIIQKQSALFAQLHGTYVFKWRNLVSGWKNKPGDTTELYEQNPALWQFFVPGCDAFINNNINPNLGIANGTPVTCHSVVLDPNGDDYNRVMAIISGDNPLPFGSEIILDNPPIAVNMTLHKGLDGKEPSKNKLRQFHTLRKLSITPQGSEDITIPISKKGGKYKATKMLNGSPLLNHISSVQVCTALAFDLAFAMTIHKAQGRTIPRVVIALTSRPIKLTQMEYASVFVGMSRVKNSDHIRLLHHLPGTLLGNQKRALAYLTELLPNKSINMYNAGFSNNNGLWDWNKALKAKF